MTARPSLLRRLEVIEAAQVRRAEAAKVEQKRAALLTLPGDFLRALKDDRPAPEAWGAFLEEARRYYTAREGEDVADLRGPALWCGEAGRSGPGQPFPLPEDAHAFAGVLEAHALRLWAGQEGADTPQARRFFRFAGASLLYRAALLRVLEGGAV